MVRKKMISILIVDDHPVLRRGLRFLLEQEPDFDVVKDLDGITDTLEYLESCESLPDVALVDISLKGETGIELIGTIRHRFPTVKNIVITMHEERVYGQRSLKNGALGYIMKSEDPAVVAYAIRKVNAGQLWISQDLSKIIVEQQYCKSSNSDENLLSFSSRERQVLLRISSGLKSSDIANDMGLSVKTINTYKERLKDKLGLESTSQLLKYACENRNAFS